MLSHPAGTPGHSIDITYFLQVAELYFEDSGSKLEKLNAQLASLGPPDFNVVDQVVHQFKGSSASFGAQQISQLCVYLREACQRQDRERCQQLLVQVKQQFEVHIANPFRPEEGVPPFLCRWEFCPATVL